MYIYIYIENKSELEQKISNYHKAANSRKREVDWEEEESLEDEVIPAATMRKRKVEDREKKKSKKRAAMAASDEMAMKIFTCQSQGHCKSCTELKEKIDDKDSMICKLENDVQAEKRRSNLLQSEVEDLKTAVVLRKPGTL